MPKLNHLYQTIFVDTSKSRAQVPKFVSVKLLKYLVTKLGNGSVKVCDLVLLFPFSLTRPGVEDEINQIFANPRT